MLRTSILSAADAFRFREFRLLWIGLAISQLGAPMQQLGLGWLVVLLAARDGTPERAPLYVGLIGLSRAGPSLVFALFAGVFADRWDRRKLLIAGKVTSSALASAFAILIFSDRAQILVIMLLSLLAAAAGAIEVPTRNALTPRLVPPASLMSAIGLTNTVTNLGGILGPLIAGVLIVPIGVGGLFAVNAASYWIAIVALFMMKPVAQTRSERRAGVLRSLADGLLYVGRQPTLRWVVTFSLIGAIFARSATQMLPVVVHDVLHAGPTELSWLLSGTALGSLLGAVASASLGGVRRRGLVVAGGTAAMGLSVLVFGLQRDLTLALLTVPFTGMTTLVFAGVSNAVTQTTAPDHLRGRAISIYSAGNQSGTPLGAMLVGVIATPIGIGLALPLSGALVVAVGVIGLLFIAPLRRESRDAIDLSAPPVAAVPVERHPAR